MEAALVELLTKTITVRVDGVGRVAGKLIAVNNGIFKLEYNGVTYVFLVSGVRSIESQ